MSDIEVAQHSTDPRQLSELAKSLDDVVRWLVATNKNTSVQTLDELSKDPDYGVRWRVAMNKNTSIPVLLKLMDDMTNTVSNKAKEAMKDRDVLGDLLGEARCFEEFHGAFEDLPDEMSHDDEEELLRKMVERRDNLNQKKGSYDEITSSMLKKVQKSQELREARIKGVIDSTNPKELDRLARNSSGTDTPVFVATNKNTPIDTLDFLSTYSDDTLITSNGKEGHIRTVKLSTYVKAAVVKNENTPREIIERLANDEDELVAQRASSRLHREAEMKNSLGDFLKESKCFESFEAWRKLH